MRDLSSGRVIKRMENCHLPSNETPAAEQERSARTLPWGEPAAGRERIFPDVPFIKPKKKDAGYL